MYFASIKALQQFPEDSLYQSILRPVSFVQNTDVYENNLLLRIHTQATVDHRFNSM